MRYSLSLAIGAAALLMPAAAFSHFQLLEPGNYLVQNELGDPQKLAPCGGTSANAGMPSGMIGQYIGGDMMHIKIKETVFHPGHFRLALAVNSRAELPKDPETSTRESPRGPLSVSAPIDASPKPPVLADGLFVHTTRPAPGTFHEADIRLPNINCEKCTLQIIQFMAEHARNADGDFSYHHCAVVNITADPAKPIDTRWR